VCQNDVRVVDLIPFIIAIRRGREGMGSFMKQGREEKNAAFLRRIGRRRMHEVGEVCM
jgi:hypothetical protein